MIKKQHVGIVISNKMYKTILVKTKSRYLHSKYPKIIVKTKKYLVHIDKNQCNIGDKIIFQQCRPISKKKNWKFVGIIKTSKF
uniref:Small ribosomal subunit protein uS17c n=1 Tax=Nitzschia alba TaxID=2858 RepID=A0A5C0F4V7_NITAL|nr:30S ribosomal protein S17 [Nitzschia alba]QEI59597.1 30S ribosomal protein S17 [Nitzschia alba]